MHCTTYELAHIHTYVYTPTHVHTPIHTHQYTQTRSTLAAFKCSCWQILYSNSVKSSRFDKQIQMPHGSAATPPTPPATSLSCSWLHLVRRFVAHKNAVENELQHIRRKVSAYLYLRICRRVFAYQAAALRVPPHNLWATLSERSGNC